MIDSEIHSEYIIEMPAELVILDRSHYTQKPGIFKKSFGYFLVVQ
jgi:hypothetical protein